MNKLQSRIQQLKKYLIQPLKNTSFPGFKSIPMYDVLFFLKEEINQDRFTSRAATIAFYQIIALIPFLIFLLNLIPFFPIAELESELISMVESSFPERISTWLLSQINDILNNKREGSLSISLLTAFWLSSNSMLAIFQAFSKKSESMKKYPWWMQRLRALLFNIIFVVSLIVSLALIVLFNNYSEKILVEWLNFETTGVIVIQILNIGLVISIIYLVISFLFDFGSAYRNSFPFFSIGAVVSTLLIVLGTFTFSWAMQTFNMYNGVYGSLGTIAAIMFLFYVIALFLLIGFELNYSIYILKTRNKK